ncbi:unnamed protein product [Mycena citricolor]|uniref:FAD/NAD(P)-binding domain-containing protein n=1 Tax=Mycena citricolor TaxID=2018698 RepID=A0AAD2HMY2_9AGAR|nr:unnamed protein product [Mycena citricolor]
MESPSCTPSPRRILVIGGGVSGLVTLRNLLERGAFDEVSLVERRDDIGGVWYLDDTPHARFQSPAYPGLVGNVLPVYLSFSGHPFPETASEVHPYPTLADTHAYLRRFAAPLIDAGRIRLKTEVVWVDQVEEGDSWDVTLSTGVVERWDAVVVCTAWYDFPVWPDTPGLQDARDAGLAVHAKDWMGPTAFAGKRVVVVGNANSANDIAAQLKSVACSPIYRSIRRPTQRRFAFLSDSRVEDVSAVARYNVTNDGNKLDIELIDGRVLANIDAVFLGTGYSPACAPFVRVLDDRRQLVPLTSSATDPPRIPSLYNHILYAPRPSLAFIGTLMSFTPFTLSDTSSTWLALFFAGRLALPDDLLAGERERVQFVLTGRGAADSSSFIAYHVLGAFELDYARGLVRDIARIAPEYASVLPTWSDDEWAQREGMYERKWVSLEAEARRESET